jgi:hypothetical protein
LAADFTRLTAFERLVLHWSAQGYANVRDWAALHTALRRTRARPACSAAPLLAAAAYCGLEPDEIAVDPTWLRRGNTTDREPAVGDTCD